MATLITGVHVEEMRLCKTGTSAACGGANAAALSSKNRPQRVRSMRNDPTRADRVGLKRFVALLERISPGFHN
eukprot:scaffold8733_cov114-Isochrysis_galbana.AAC.7